MSDGKCLFAALALGLGLLCPFSLLGEVRGDDDPLPDVKARMAIEAQRVEKEFTDNRAAAYKLVRAASPNPVEAVSRLRTVLAMLEADTALEPKRREQLIVTIKWDLGKVKEVSEERRRSALSSEEVARSIRSDMRPSDPERREGDRRGPVSEADRIIGGRGRVVADAGADRRSYGDRRIGELRSVDKSAIPIEGNVKFPADWYALSMRRSPQAKMTAKERELMDTLNKVISVEMTEFSFSEAIDYLEKLTGQSFLVDRRAVEEAGVTYDGTKVNLKLKATTRSILKRFLADLNLTYIVKDEHIQITSIARAREETTTRTYYLGELASQVDVRYGPLLGRLQMIENVNRIITLITQTVEPQTWKVNNPEAPGTIAFDPISMSLVIKQTAEFHLRMGGGH
jgi:hypothetical protein